MEILSYEEIMKRMLNRIPDSFDKREGAVIWDALAPAAMELETMYYALDTILKESFADTASRDYLIRRARERGLVPEKATKAILKGVFDVKISLGSRFNLGELNYIAVKYIQQSGKYYEYQLQCETSGREGGSYFGDLIPMEYIDGLTYAKLTELLIPGEEEEETEVFRQRYFESFNVQSYGGNISDYKKKVHEIEGVGAVKVTPIWNGGGTVKLTIINSDFDVASQSLINKVQEIIDPTQDGTGIGIAPIGHIVTVDTAQTVPINITTNITFTDNYTWSMLKIKVEQIIKDYLLELRKSWALKNEITSKQLVVRIARIEANILNLDGILDIQNTAINGSTNNLILTNFQIPTFGGITV